MKTLASTLSLVLLGLAAAAGATQLSWSPAWQCVAPDTEGSVSVMLDEALDIRTIEVWIAYDPEVVTGLTSTPGSIYDGVGCFLWEDYEEETPGLFHAYVVIMGGECYATGPGELLTWHFSAGSDVGATVLEVVEVYISDPQADPLPDPTLGSATVAVCDPVSGATPRPGAATLRLSPNPFNPSVRLLLEADSGGPARLDVFDAAGRRVDTPWTGDLGSGPRVIDWRGRDAAGRPLPSGTYLFRLSGPGRQPIVSRGLLVR